MNHFYVPLYDVHPEKPEFIKPDTRDLFQKSKHSLHLRLLHCLFHLLQHDGEQMNLLYCFETKAIV